MTITSLTSDITPRAWIGCLACYNAGHLVGDWFDAVTADEITTYDVHGAHSRADSHDELWVMDHEYIPVKGEMSPADAAAWGAAISEVDVNRAGFSAAFVSRLRHGVVRCFDSTGFLL